MLVSSSPLGRIGEGLGGVRSRGLEVSQTTVSWHVLIGIEAPSPALRLTFGAPIEESILALLRLCLFT